MELNGGGQQKPKSWAGPAQLCFLFQDGNASLFQGHFIDMSSRRCFGVTATETEVPASDAQCCCCQGDDAPTWYRLTIIDFKTGREFTEVVSKRGGDYALIHGQHIKFITDSLLTDEEAVSFVQRNGRFGVSLEGLDESAVLVSIGHFEMHSVAAFSALADQGDSRVLEHNENERETTTTLDAGGHHHHNHTHHLNAQAHERCCGVDGGEEEGGLDLSDHEHDGDVDEPKTIPTTPSDTAAVSKPSAPPGGWLRRERKTQATSDDKP